MCLRLPNGPQTQFNLDEAEPEPHPLLSKTVSKLQMQESIHQRIFQFFQNLVKSKINIPSLFSFTPSNPMHKSPSIQKLQLFYEPPRFSSTTSISDRLSIQLYSEPSSQHFSYLSVSDLDQTLEEECFDSGYKLTLEHIECIFDSKQQQLILVSIGIILKYLYITKEEIKRENLLFLLFIGAILGNKVYHDADMPMIIKEYSDGFGIDGKKLKSLEKRMLRSIDYNCEVGKETISRIRFYLFS